LIDAGVVGDYKNARIFVRSSASGIITEVIYKGNGLVSDKEISTLNATESVTIHVVLAWATRILVVDVVSSQASAVYNLNSR